MEKEKPSAAVEEEETAVVERVPVMRSLKPQEIEDVWKSVTLSWLVVAQSTCGRVMQEQKFKNVVNEHFLHFKNIGLRNNGYQPRVTHPFFSTRERE